MQRTVLLKNEIECKPAGVAAGYAYYKALSYRKTPEQPIVAARAEAIRTLFAESVPYIYRNDRIVGSLRMMFVEVGEEELNAAKELFERYGERDFATNFDHFAPDYRRFLADGLPGTAQRIRRSMERHAGDAERMAFLQAMHTAMDGFAQMIANHAACAERLMGAEGYCADTLKKIAADCRTLLVGAPQTFAQALQLVWFCHTAFLLENRYAMALGRMDQYLYPFYQRDVEQGILTPQQAQELLENVFIKIYERSVLRRGHDVVNIAVGGMERDGRCCINELSYLILRAVKECNVPGPNLSARIAPGTPDDFLDESLQVIGTGIGYPALMNDAVNVAALKRYGYEETDVYDYSMVGCIENFITGKQPPWTDGRFDTPKYFEYLLNRGSAVFGGGSGIDTGDVEEITSMQQLLEKFEQQLSAGVAAYVSRFLEANTALDAKNFVSPFLSCFCEDCIGRGKDINDGGSKYPSVHGAALMGVGTVCDSLAAIEKTVFVDRTATLKEIAEAVKCNFEGCEQLHALLSKAPKYGNDDDFVDKYAVWFVEFLSREFEKYKTPDGGGIYVAMAANINNIYAGRVIGATPDGRLAGCPISDAASPSYGRDRLGPTATVNSVTKPDYTKVACGTVINQKFSPAMFTDDANRAKLLTLLKVYFSKGGQELQINATSRKVLIDAMEHPENYGSLIVRVSGFSAFFNTLHRDVQKDILARTQQG
ncbi:MAG: hypothetical protein IJC25_06840 [Clostridia bacterium]|nr:hypothetical protein [Clostridia bacterium]